MGTPFSDIYSLFLSQIKSHSLNKMADEALKENLQDWLMMAIPYFHTCRKKLEDFDLITGQFNVELTMTERTILAKYMLMAYLMPKIVDESNIANHLNPKDYRTYSPANLLKVLETIKKEIKEETSTLQSQYSWNPEALKEWFKK